MNKNRSFWIKQILFVTASIEANVLYRSNNNNCSLRAHLFLSYYIIWVPWSNSSFAIFNRVAQAKLSKPCNKEAKRCHHWAFNRYVNCLQYTVYLLGPQDNLFFTKRRWIIFWLSDSKGLFNGCKSCLKKIRRIVNTRFCSKV